MGLAWFVYTIAVMLVSVVACAACVMAWTLTSRRIWLVAGGGFATYLLETAVILYSEYVGDKPILGEYLNHGLLAPVVSITLGVALVTIVWSWVRLRLHATVTKRQVIACAALYALFCAATAPVVGHAGAWRSLLFWEARDLMILSSVVYAWWHYRRRSTHNERADLERSATFWKVALVLACCMVVEDAILIALWRPVVVEGTLLYSFWWHWTERNISENLLLFWCAGRAALQIRRLMSVFAQHPAEGVGEKGDSSLASELDSRLPRYCDEHGLSQREREVLRLALQERSTQEIASELFISAGTVKAHLHRVYAKCGVTTRKDLLTSFWHF